MADQRQVGSLLPSLGDQRGALEGAEGRQNRPRNGPIPGGGPRPKARMQSPSAQKPQQNQGLQPFQKNFYQILDTMEMRCYNSEHKEHHKNVVRFKRNHVNGGTHAGGENQAGPQ